MTGVWRNWAGEQACVPAVHVRPSSVDEVRREVALATDEGRVVRVAGAGHSFTDAVLTDGTLLSLDRMDRVLDVDTATGLVRVEAGIRIRALSDALAAHGLALENLGDIDVQSIAGATATGTHGTGARLRNVSAQVVAAQVVAGDGEMHELDGGDALRAARVSVGALGVVTEMTLRCVPSFTLRGVDRPEPLDEVLASMVERAEASRHFEFFVFPHTGLALTRTNEVVDGPPRPPGVATRTFEDVVLTNGAFGAVANAGRRFPARIPQLMRLLARGFSERERVDRSDRVFASPRLVRFTEQELAIPRAAAADVVPAVIAAAERYPIVFPIEVRFVAGDDALLSPAGGRDTVYVAVHNLRGMPWEAFFREVHDIADPHGARPHWGKRHFHTAETLAPRYPEWDRFQAVRRALDPAQTFANGYVRRVLGPVA